MSVTGDFSAVNRLAADLGKVGAGITAKAVVVVAKTTHDIEAGAKRICVEKHIIDTGTLMNSISSTVRGLTGEVGPTVDYAPHQEYGTWKMAARPYMGPATDAAEAPFAAAMEKVAEVDL